MITVCKVQDGGSSYTAIINGVSWSNIKKGSRFWQDVQEWLDAGNTPEPEFTQAELDAQAEDAAAAQKQTDKLVGVEFEGVMCSATAEDMWGLSAIKEWVAAGQTANFKFENGNTLAITPENYAAFQAVWVPFRASFF